MDAMRKRSQKEFVVVTLIALLATASIIVLYGAMLGTFEGGKVTVVALNGTLKYNRTNSATASDWNVTLDNVPIGSSWYALFNTSSTGYQGNVNITWTLQNETSTDVWENVTPSVNQTTNNHYLDGTAGQVIYASTDGNQGTNKDWGASTTSAGTYRIKMTVTTA
jgi:hypothetical protein